MKKLVFVFFLLTQHLLIAQLLDDSTKVVYTSRTTFLTTEQLVKNNLIAPYTNPDTSIYLREKFSRIDYSNRELQHLGFLGSAILDQRYGLKDQPGRTYGFSGYNPYFKSVDEMPYFNTRSPFLNISVLFGGENRALIDFGLSRNVNPNWNVGFNINRITADKQVARSQDGDRSTESVSFDVYTHYKNDTIPYEIAVSFISFKHEIADIGGVFAEDDSIRAVFFQYNDAITQLENAVTRDQRTRFHLYHQYDLGSKLQMYHQYDRVEREYRFTDLAEPDTIKFGTFYPMFNLNTDTTRERSDYSSSVNEAGIKGEVNDIFYRFYVKQRSLIYDTRYIIEETVDEIYGGAYVRFDWNDKFAVIGSGELSDEGLYRLKGELSSNIFEASFSSLRASPSFQALHYEGNHHNWDNEFKPVLTNRLGGQLNLTWGNISLSPKASFTQIKNFVYLNSDQVSTQSSRPVNIQRMGGSLDFEILRGLKFLGMNDNEVFRFENKAELRYVSKNPDKLIKMPALLYTGRFFWRGDWFQNTVPTEVGANFYYRTSFRGNSYDPVTSQFYLQNDLKLKNYMAVDLFVNMKINNLTAFIKWTHVNQDRNDGYMTTPFYPGQQAITDFGIRWLFFD